MQYSKGVHNLAPGLGKAIADPREAEARAREASARAERELGSQIQSRMEAVRMQQQAQELQGQQQLAQQFHQQQTMQQQGSQFDRELEARSTQAQANRDFQREQSYTQLDSQEARANQQYDLQQQQMEMQGLQADRGYDLQLQQMSDRNYNADRTFGQAQSQFDRTFDLQQSEANRSQSNYQNTFNYRASNDAANRNLAGISANNAQGRWEAEHGLKVQTLRAQYGEAEASKRRQAGADAVKLLQDTGVYDRLDENKLVLDRTTRMKLKIASIQNPAVGAELKSLLENSAAYRTEAQADIDAGALHGSFGAMRSMVTDIFGGTNAEREKKVQSFGSSLGGSPGTPPSPFSGGGGGGGGFQKFVPTGGGGGNSSGQMTGRGPAPQGFQQAMANPGSYNPSPGMPAPRYQQFAPQGGGDPYNTGALYGPARGSFGDWNSPPPLDPGIATEANRPNPLSPQERAAYEAAGSTYSRGGGMRIDLSEAEHLQRMQQTPGFFDQFFPQTAGQADQQDWADQKLMDYMNTMANDDDDVRFEEARQKRTSDAFFEHRNLMKGDDYEGTIRNVYDKGNFNKDLAKNLLSHVPAKNRTKMLKFFEGLTERQFNKYYMEFMKANGLGGGLTDPRIMNGTSIR